MRTAISPALMRLLRAAFPLTALLVGTAALAYVLPQSAILRRMGEARDELRLSTLRVEGSMSFSGAALQNAASTLGAPPEHGELRAEAVLSIRVPGRCHLALSRPDGNTLSFVATGAGVKGPELPAVRVALEEACAIFAARGSGGGETRAQIERHIRSRGVQSRLSSLARFGGKVVYLLGDPQEGKPQFWVYKEDAFRPARLKFTDKAGKNWDIRFLDYSSPSTGDAFPRTLEVWSGQERQLRLTALSGDRGAKINDALFK